MNASRYVDILLVGSNVVTLTGRPSTKDSSVSVHRGRQVKPCYFANIIKIW